RDERALIIAASNWWLVALDTLSDLPPWLSDALCRLATGGGFGTRQLFTDDEEVIFDAQRPVLLNSIEELSSRPDLLDRALVLQLPALGEEERQTERDFWGRWEEARPRVLGALLDALAGRCPSARRSSWPGYPAWPTSPSWPRPRAGRWGGRRTPSWTPTS